jgi:putative NIF3 family GTP cyclohydrolase 1 type 2
MSKNDIFRRKFLNVAGSGIGAAFLLQPLGRSQSSQVTAGEVMERIKKNVAVPWRAITVDTIKGGGSPDTVVTGIATSFMATLDVLQRSVKAGKNMVIAHELTFWNNLDVDAGLTDDPVYLHKLEFIRKNGLFVHRFHDHWHARKPDGINEGWNKVMGWDRYKFDAARSVYELPETVTLEAYAEEVKRRLKSDSVRVVGNPHLQVKTVSKGFNKLPTNGAPPSSADVTITYEPDRENDNVEWERDTVLSGQKRGFVIISHNRMEEYGMENCANWLRTFIPEVPIEFIASGDPFWRTT